MLARQLKLRLVSEDGSDIPRSCSNVVVSIHAIATFQAFNDYLRPRILAATSSAERSSASTSAPQVGGAGGMLSGFLAAFAATSGSSQDANAQASGSGTRISSSLGADSTSDAKPTSSLNRRRSSRLSGLEPSTADNDAAVTTAGATTYVVLFQ